MGELILLGLLLFFIPPVLSIIAMVRAGSLAGRVTLLERELAQLRGASPAAQSANAPADGLAPAQAEASPEPLLDAAGPPDADPITGGGAAEDAADPAPETAKVKRPRIDWERRIAANWLVWTGAIVLALGGLFLVRVAIDAGLFGPTARTGLAAILGVGLIAASFHAKRLNAVRAADTAVRHVPTLLAGAGVVTLFGATLAAGVLYALLPPIAIFILFAAVAAAAVALAWIYGPALAALGLAGAYFGPFFTGAEGGSPLMLMPYAFAVSAGALAIIRLRGWPFVSWLALGGAMMWGLLGLTDPSAHAAWAAPAYALGLAAAAALFGNCAAAAPIDWEKNNRAARLRDHGEALFVAHLFWLGAAGLLVFSAVDRQVGAVAGLALSLFAGMGLLASWRREGYALFTLISAGAVLSALALWPSWIGAEPAFAAIMAALFGLAGWRILPSLKVQAPVAAVSALFAPAAMMIAAWRLERFDPGAIWGVAALALAALYLLVLDRLGRREGGFDAHPGTGASYAAGASVFLSLGAVFGLSGLWLGTGFSLVCLASALIYRRFGLDLVRRIAVLAAVASVFLLLRPDLLLGAAVSATPVFNEISLSIVPAIGAIAGAAWILRREAGAAQALRGASAFLGFALAGLLIRHWSGGGRLDGPSGGLGEASGYAITYLGASASLFLRQRVGRVQSIARWAALAAGLFGVGLALSALGWDSAAGWPILNLLLTSLAMPAVLLAVLGVGLRRCGRPAWGRMADVAAMGLGLVWALLETRRAFTGPALYAGGFPGDAEMWMYSAALVVYALSLLAFGAWRGARLSRFTSLAVLACALIKVFLFDLSALEGALRAASFIGLGLTLLGTALFYQRFVFPDRGDGAGRRDRERDAPPLRE